MGHRVVVAENGKQALDLLDRGTFDAILMDVQMPEMDGFEATRILREEEKSTGKHLPVVAMTALAMSGDRERCMEVGMDGYLSKPIRPQELDAALDALVALKEGLSKGEEVETISNGSIEVTQLLDRIDDDRSLLAELIDIFRREYPENLQSAQRAVDANNSADLQRAGHTLRGALANLSAGRASDIAAELEALGQSNDLNKAQSILDNLVTELGNVMHALEALCPVVAQ
jgi:CheY-like chemotaxis protein